MSLIETAIRAVEATPLPDPVTRLGIDFLVGRTRRKLAFCPPEAETAFVREMTTRAIAEHTDTANEQHYELPPAFFEWTLGPRRKYSCCFFETGRETLAQAEERALAETAAHAGFADGQSILELGCGWGSLTLFMARRFPRARIVAVSNSTAQRNYIEEQARNIGCNNIQVVTADMNDFAPDQLFDRIVSVEMFEHMANWRALLGRIRNWITPQGRLFLHVFSHRCQPYRFDPGDRSDWIARHFFTGGIMPSHGMIRHFADAFTVEAEWGWDGRHYARTAQEWLSNFDANHPKIEKILHPIYGLDTKLWMRRWRLFYLATAGLFGHDHGREWGISHYRLRPTGMD